MDTNMMPGAMMGSSANTMPMPAGTPGQTDSIGRGGPGGSLMDRMADAWETAARGIRKQDPVEFMRGSGMMQQVQAEMAKARAMAAGPSTEERLQIGRYAPEPPAPRRVDATTGAPLAQRAAEFLARRRGSAQGGDLGM